MSWKVGRCVRFPTVGVIDRWRSLVAGMENVGRNPNARPEDVDEARERLSNLLHRIRIVPVAW